MTNERLQLLSIGTFILSLICIFSIYTFVFNKKKIGSVRKGFILFFIVTGILSITSFFVFGLDNYNKGFVTILGITFARVLNHFYSLLENDETKDRNTRIVGQIIYSILTIVYLVFAVVTYNKLI